MDEKTYTVMELAEKAGTARTTINDWLTRYSAYIDFRMVGRRRVYTESAVEVLREIAELRGKGASPAEIESELAKKHPVRPEVEEPVRERKSDEQKSDARSSDEHKAAEENPDGFALIARQQSEELGRIFAESFRDMADRMVSLEEKSKKSERKVWIAYAVVFLLLALLCAGACLLHKNLKIQSEQTTRLESSVADKGSAIRSIEEKTVRLSGSSVELQKGISELRAGLAEQKKEFSRAILEMKNSKDAEIALMKEKFAEEKKKMLEEMEALTKQKLELQKKNEQLLAEQKKIAEEKQNTAEKKGN